MYFLYISADPSNQTKGIKKQQIDNQNVYNTLWWPNDMQGFSHDFRIGGPKIHIWGELGHQLL